MQPRLDFLNTLPPNEHVAALNQRLAEELAVGVAVHTGPVVAGEMDVGELREEQVIVAETSNVAARLESQTRIQQVDLLVSDTVKSHLMADFYEVGESFEFDLKGKSSKVIAHEIRPSV